MAARLNIGVSADAKQASDAFRDLAADIKNVGGVSVEVGEGISSVEAAIKKLSSAPDTPMALARATAKAKVEVDELRASLEKTPASAEQMKKIEAALKQADAAMEAAVVRAGKLRESQEEVAQKMGLTAKGAESLGNSFGSLSGIMNKMADSSSKTSQSIAKVGFSVMALGQAFEFGYDAGTKLREGLGALGVTVPDLSDKVAALVQRTNDLVRGYEDAELVESAAMSRARQIIALREAQTAAERALLAAQQAAGVVWVSAETEREKLIQKLNAYDMILSRTTKSEAEYQETIKANASAIREVADAAEAQGISLDVIAPRFAYAAEQAKQYAGAQEGVAGTSGDATKKIDEETEALKRKAEAEKALERTGRPVTVETDLGRQRREAAEFAQTMRDVNAAYDANVAKQREWISEAQRVEQGMQQWTDATRGPRSALGSLSGDFTQLDAAARSFVEAGGDITKLSVSMTPIILGVAQASREATKALLDQALATKTLTEAQAEALGVTKGWTDYVLVLKEGYESGVTSLSTYITMLSEFRTQIVRLFGTIGGEGREALNGLVSLIDELIGTAGSADRPRDMTYRGQLERAFDRDRGRE